MAGRTILVGGALLGLFSVCGCAQLILAGADGIGRSVAREPVAETKASHVLRRRTFSLRYPANWSLPTQEKNYDPDHRFWLETTKKHGFLLFVVEDKLMDLQTVVNRQVVVQVEKKIPRPQLAAFSSWGQYRGQGVVLSGRNIDGEATTVRIFAFAAGGRTYTLIEYATDDDRSNLNLGFRLVEITFRASDSVTVAAPSLAPAPNGRAGGGDTAAAAAGTNIAEARKLYFAGRSPEAVTLLTQVLDVCKSGCRASHHTSALMLMGTIRASTDQGAASKTFEEMLKVDRKVTLDPALATREATQAFNTAVAALPPEPPSATAGPALPSATTTSFGATGTPTATPPR